MRRTNFKKFRKIIRHLNVLQLKLLKAINSSEHLGDRIDLSSFKERINFLSNVLNDYYKNLQANVLPTIVNHICSVLGIETTQSSPATMIMDYLDEDFKIILNAT